MATPRRPGRPKTLLPTCYHEGFLEKRSFKDKTARKLWTSLCGNSLFFFNNNKDNDYVEKLELSDFVSLTDDSSNDRNLEAAKLKLHLKNGDIQLTAPSLEARELWKGFILSVAELAVPCSLNLLPGQILMLREVVEKERVRRKPLPSPPPAAPVPAPATKIVTTSNIPPWLEDHYLSIPSEMPVCFQQVSRAEAELILERNQEKGNLLLRPGRSGSSFAITTRQDLNGPVFRHYLVNRRPEGGFAIAVDSPILGETLHKVINCLVEKTGGVLKPLVLEQAYEESITFVDNNRESGERSIISANTSPVPPIPAGPKPAPSPEARCDQEDDTYVNPSYEDADEIDDCTIPQLTNTAGRTLPRQMAFPDNVRLGPGGALLPPDRPVSLSRPRSMSETPKVKPREHGLPTIPISQNLTKELKEKLLKRQAVSEEQRNEEMKDICAGNL